MHYAFVDDAFLLLDLYIYIYIYIYAASLFFFSPKTLRKKRKKKRVYELEVIQELLSTFLFKKRRSNIMDAFGMPF